VVFAWFLRGFCVVFLTAGIRSIFCFLVGCENYFCWSITFSALAEGIARFCFFGLLARFLSDYFWFLGGFCDFCVFFDGFA